MSIASKSTKLDTFKQKICNVTALLMRINDNNNVWTYLLFSSTATILNKESQLLLFECNDSITIMKGIFSINLLI